MFGILVSVDSESSVTDRTQRNIRIADNVVRGTTSAGVLVDSAADVVIDGNRIVDPAQLPIDEPGRYGIGLRNAESIDIQNTLVTSDDDVLGFGWRRGTTEVRLTDNEFVVAGDQRDVTVEEV